MEREVPLSLSFTGCLAGLFVPLLHLPLIAAKYAVSGSLPPGGPAEPAVREFR